jgi:hypothetical protein
MFAAIKPERKNKMRERERPEISSKDNPAARRHSIF